MIGYEPPIWEEVTTNIKEETDGLIMKAVCNVGIRVNKEELIKALKYDRDQYVKGYDEGYSAGYTKGYLVACDIVQDTLTDARRREEQE